MTESGEESEESEAGQDGPSFTIRNRTFRAGRPEAGLYLVATPIGNLSDVTIRALEVIAGADRLVCEDTRVTTKLLQRFAIRRRMASYHEHSGAEADEAILRDLQAGLSVALVSDAGTPLVSDPGFRIAEGAAAAGVPVVPVPGASAPLAALLASGLPSDSFFFAGFPPTKDGARRRRFEELARVPGTLVFFEAPHRVAASLADMASVFGDRRAAVCRELTKLHETIYRDGLAALARAFSAMEAVRGEIVVCIAPPLAAEAPSQADADAVLGGLLAEMKPAQAAAEAARLTGLPRRDLYRRALALKAGEA